MQKTGIVKEVKPTGKSFKGKEGYTVTLADGSSLLVNLSTDEIWRAGDNVEAECVQRENSRGLYWTVDLWKNISTGVVPQQFKTTQVIPGKLDLWVSSLRLATQMLIDSSNTGVTKDNMYEKAEEIHAWLNAKSNA
jgi:hypothetical protein